MIPPCINSAEDLQLKSKQQNVYPVTRYCQRKWLLSSQFLLGLELQKVIHFTFPFLRGKVSTGRQFLAKTRSKSKQSFQLQFFLSPVLVLLIILLLVFIIYKHSWEIALNSSTSSIVT